MPNPRTTKKRARRPASKHGLRYKVAISKAAEQLGVTREHLSRVVNRKRVSPGLKRRWEALQAA